MKKILKKIILGFIVALLSIIVSAVILAFIFEKDIKAIFVREISKSLAAEISYHDFRFSLIRNFPYASINLSDVRLTASLPLKQSDTLIKAGRIALSFSIWDMLRKNYTLKKVEVNNAKLHFRVFKNGSDNYHLWKEPMTGKEGFKMDIQKVILRKTAIIWNNEMSGNYIHLTCSKITASWKMDEGKQKIRLKGELLLNKFMVSGADYFENKTINADLIFQSDQSIKEYRIDQGKIMMGELSLDMKGKIRELKNHNSVFIFLEGKKNKIAKLINELPSEFDNIKNSYDADGIFDMQVTISGYYGKGKLPGVIISLSVNEGKVYQKESGIKLTDINLKASYKNKRFFNPDSALVEILSFSSKLNDGRLNASLKWTDLNRPDVQLKAEIEGALADVIDLLGYDTLVDVTGTIKTKFTYTGRLESAKQLSADNFLAATFHGEAAFQSVGFKIKNQDLVFKDISGSCSFNNNDVNLNSISGRLSGSDFTINGDMKNIFPFLLKKSGDIKIVAGIKSNFFNLDEILSGRGDGKNEYSIKLPGNLSFALTADIRKIKFRTFEAGNLKGDFVFSKGVLTGDHLTFDSMDGSVTSGLRVEEQSADRISVSCISSISGVNIQKMFRSFENFGQNSLTDKQIRGTLFAQVSYSSHLNKNLKTDPSSVTAKADIRVENGELVDYKPLMGLSKYIRLEELKDVKFSSLNNIIEIRDQTIYIPEMEVRSTALNLQLTGTHSFKNEIDYHLKLLLSELLSRKIKKPKEDFGVIQDDGLGKTTLFIRITGTTENPVFKYDAKSAIQKVMNDFKKERENLKNLFKKDSLSVIEKRSTELQENGKFIIHWEEEALTKPDSVALKNIRKKSDEQKIKVDWE